MTDVAFPLPFWWDFCCYCTAANDECTMVVVALDVGREGGSSVDELIIFVCFCNCSRSSIIIMSNSI